MAIAAKDTMSHGATSRVAKLAFPSTILPLLTMGCEMALGLFTALLRARGLMRDDVGASGWRSWDSDKSGCREIFRFFLEGSWTVPGSFVSETLLVEFDEDWENGEDSCILRAIAGDGAGAT